MRTSWLLVAALAAAPACAGAEGPAPVASAAPPAAAPAPPPPASGQAPAPAAPPSSVAAAPAGPERCGALDCALYDTPAAALASVLEAGPRVLAVGETHAQKGAEEVISATRRFTELLPGLAPRASDLIIELWVADPRCSKEKVAKVQKQQQAATQTQAEGNQNEFVTLAERAKALGVQPHVLRPTCEEYDQILRAGDDAIDQMLTMISRLTSARVKDLLARRGDAGKMVITYGGALHNDLAPRPGRERWSFGPELGAHTGGKYVELDIIVREYIKDNDSWRALPWYAHFDREKHRDKVVLFRPAPGSYVMIFPAGAP